MKRFSMTAYSGATLEPLFWEKMVIDISGIQASAKLPALREHIRDRPVGVIDRTSKQGGKFNAEGFFVKTKDGNECKALLQEGFPMQASIGVFPLKVERISKDETAQVNGADFKGPGVVWRESHVREISFTSLGMDADTSVAVAASAAKGVNMTAALETLTEDILRQPDPNRADFMLYKLAKELVEKEGITLEAAFKKVFQKNPKLYAQYFDSRKFRGEIADD